MSRSSDEDCLLIEVIKDSPEEGISSMEEHRHSCKKVCVTSTIFWVVSVACLLSI